MPAPIGWRVLWPWAVAVALASGVVALQTSQRQRTAAQLQRATDMRDRLDRALLHIEDRHLRTIRRAREAVRDPREDKRVAMLAWNAEHYTTEMERFIGEAEATLQSLLSPATPARRRADLDRLGRQLDRIRDGVLEVAPALDQLLELSEDYPPEDVDIGLQELERVERGVLTAVRVAEGMARRSSRWQITEAQRGSEIIWILWVIVAAWIPAAAWLSYRPLARLRALGSDAQPDRPPRSREERELVARFAALRQRLEEVESTLSERTRGAEKAGHGVRRAERDLGLLRIYIDNLVNSIRSAIVVTDQKGRLTSFNLAARRLLGLTEGDLDRPIDALPLYTALMQRQATAGADLERALAEQAVLRYEGITFPDAGGPTLLDLTVAPYLDEGGAARGLMWVSDDVTDAVQTKNQLLAAEHLAAIGRISAQVAHEIRNPLSAIGLNAELLEEEFAAGLDEPRRAEAVSLLSAIASEIERLSDITEGYLELARLPRPAVRDADLNQLITDLLSMLHEEMRAGGIEVDLDLASPSPRALVDPGQLRQALLNIVRNSREAMGDGGTLRVTTRHARDGCRVELTDTGSGLAKDTAARAFEPFFTTKEGGTGLGLSLTQQIVTDHQGSIELSPTDDGGTRVTLTLPAAGAAGDEVPATHDYSIAKH